MHKEPSNIYNPNKNLYHQLGGVPGKTYIHTTYSLDLICNEGLRDPHLSVVEYNRQGEVIKTLIEIEFDVNVGFVNQTDPLPSGSIVKLEFVPAKEYKVKGDFCHGKPHVLLCAVIEKHFTLHDGQPGIFYDFRRNIPNLVNHRKCFYTPVRKQARNLLDHRPDLNTYTQCPLPRCRLQERHSHPTRGSRGTSLQHRKPRNLRPGGNWGTSCPRRKSRSIHPIRTTGTSPPNMDRKGTRSPSRTIHPIRTTGTSPPTWTGKGQDKVTHPRQSTQSGQQGLPPPQHGQEGDKVPIPDNPPNQDNRDFPPNITTRGTTLQMEDLKGQTLDLVVDRN